MSIPPEEIRQRAQERLEESGYGPGSYVLMMVLATFALAGVQYIPEFMESHGLDWTYKWFTESIFNRQELYFVYFWLIIIVAVSLAWAFMIAVEALRSGARKLFGRPDGAGEGIDTGEERDDA